MKTVKRALALVLALTLLLAMSATVFADDAPTHTITISNTQSGHTYEAYQVFKGNTRTVEADGTQTTVLTDIAWGNGVDGTALLDELKTLDAYKDCASAEAVADVLKGFKAKSSELDAFAKIVGRHLRTVAGTSTESASPYTINVTGDGYYLVKDRSVSENQTATKYILEVLNDVQVAAKADLPTIDKVIVNADSNNGSDGKGTAQDVGSAVQFKLTSTVPSMDGYDSYTYTVKDTLSDGLTFKENSVVIKIKGTAANTEVTLVKDTNYTVSASGQTFTIDFTNFISQKSKAGQTIEITYSATLNEKALSRDKETNTVHLEYSNDPNNSSSIGKTPDKTVYVYDFDIVVNKYTNNGENEKKLADAKFVLKKAGETDDVYYHWDDSTKTVSWVPVANAADLKTVDDWEKAGVTVAVTDSNGKTTFKGLDSGKYALVEIDAPNGYNLLKEPVDVEITVEYDAETGKPKTTSATAADNNGQYSQTKSVENKSGAELPSTGGIGTTVFYVLGGLLVVCAGVLLITKRRMNKNA